MSPSQSAPDGAEDGVAHAAAAAEGPALRRVGDTDRAPPPPTRIEPGTVIADRYRIDDLLGEGGMGKVYRAEHVHMRKQVAVKVLHNDVTTTAEVVSRFEREAVAAGNISHPNVASATDFGQLDDGSFFLVLELVLGRDLRSLVKEGPLAPERAVRIVRQIASAAAAAHAAGVVHRDLKPENIMLVGGKGEEDFVKVLDFGIAKIDSIGMVDTEARTQSPASSGPQPLTRMGAVFGTPDYMSPEQAMGQPIDARADLYSIGVIFHELLSGERPFQGGAVSLMRKHVLQDAPPLPASVAAVTDPRLQAIITKLLQKSPVDRYADAGELGAALDVVLASSPGISTAATPSPTRSRAAMQPASATTQPAPAVQRRRRRWGTWLLLAAVILGAGVLSWDRYGLSSWRTLAGITAPRSGHAPVAAPQTPSASPLEPSAIAIASAPTPGDSASASAAPSTAAAPSAAPSGEPAASAASAASDEARGAEGDDAVAEEAEEPQVAGGAAPPHAAHAIPGGHHSGAHGPAHGGPPRHKPPPHQKPTRQTGPGGIYVPPPSQWFR